MVRTTVRGILAGGIAAAALVAVAAPAAAKCGHGTGAPCPDPVRLEATIYDSTWRPIVIRGDDAWRMLNVTGANTTRITSGTTPRTGSGRSTG
jgi:hypothetical protein